MGGKGAFGVRLARVLRFTAALALFSSAEAPAQPQPNAASLATGKILVARRSLLDPSFAKTVILLVQYDEEKGTAGLIINRQTKIPLSRLAKELEGTKGRSDPLYIGGPVETSGVMALLRAGKKPEDAEHVVADIYVISSKAALEKTIAASPASNAFHLYVGYAGWDAGQLEWELEQDAWQVLPANPGIVFDPRPETLWSRLAEEEELQLASVISR
jgi:putative transcriptional regulator